MIGKSVDYKLYDLRVKLQFLHKKRFLSSEVGSKQNQLDEADNGDENGRRPFHNLLPILHDPPTDSSCNLQATNKIEETTKRLSPGGFVTL